MRRARPSVACAQSLQTMQCVRLVVSGARREPREEVGQLAREEARQRRRGPVGAVGVDVEAELEALLFPLLGGRVVRQPAQVDVSCRAHALPVGDRAARGAGRVSAANRCSTVPQPWLSPVITTAALFHAGSTRTAAAACGRRSSSGSGSRAAAAARRPAGSRPW